MWDCDVVIWIVSPVSQKLAEEKIYVKDMWMFSKANYWLVG